MTRIAKLPLAEADADALEQSSAGLTTPQLLEPEPQAQSPEGTHEAVAAATALRPADQVAHNLPAQLTSFVGRDAEMAQVRAMLADSRLVTLTGAGGVGKTRLALEVAASVVAEFTAGVWLAELAPLTDASLIPLAVARALGLPDAPRRSAMETVTSFIGTRRALIVLDNCEHLLDACAVLAEDLLRACPALVVLATSREPVGAVGEATWLVPSLPVDGAAIDLFADRGLRVRVGFAITPENAGAVAEICRRLDGIPLAIELAAARLRAFSPGEIAAGLHDRFRLLTGGSRTAARRQQTLRASVDWSHALLTEPERVLFRRLAVFAGGFELEAAQAVAAGETLKPGEPLNLLALLVDKSLVAAEESEGATRYRLPETIRQYSAEKLADSGEADEVRTRHRDYYTARASRLDPPGDGDRRLLIRRLEAEIDNLRAAFAWSLELSQSETALRLASALEPLWLGRCRMLEGLAWFEAAFASQSHDVEQLPLEVRVRAQADVLVLEGASGRPGAIAQGRAEKAVDLARELGNPALLGQALLGAAYAAGAPPQVRWASLAEAAVLTRQAGDIWTLTQILGFQAYLAVLSGDPILGRSAAEEGLALAEQIGDDYTSGNCRAWLGWALILHGELHHACRLLNDLITEAEATRNLMWKMWGLAFLARGLVLTGRLDDARAAGSESVAIADDLGLGAYAYFGYDGIALAATAAEDSAALREVIQAIRQRFGRDVAANHVHMVEALLAAGDIHAARRRADHAISSSAMRGTKHASIIALLASARVALAVGDIGRASDDAHQALAVARDTQSHLAIADALELLGGLAQRAGDQDKAARLLGAADVIRQRTGYQRFPLRRREFDVTVAALRSSMGDAVFGRAFTEGAGISLDEAVNYALRRRGERKRPEMGWPSLTPAERDVARLVAEGLANKEIGARLFVSPRTVQTHLTHIYGKLGVTSRVQLAQQAARNAQNPATVPR